MFGFHVGPLRGPAADGKEAEALTHFMSNPLGPRLSAALVGY
jgi:hypothetical protein